MNTFRQQIACAALTLGIIVIGNIVIAAQQPENAPDRNISASDRAKVIDSVFENINRTYVFPEMAKKMEAHVRGLVGKGEYDSVTSGQKLAEKLTEDLQSVSKDGHLRVRFSYETLPVRSRNDQPSEAEIDERKQFMKNVNYGFEKVERMAGNIGYLEFRGFFDHESGADTVAAAMNFLSNTDAMIIDLRRNGGGSPMMVALISSYLFGEEKVHLNDLYWREGDRTDEFWTMPERVKGPRYEGKDIYILTSKYTFSGAEEFTYNLKNLKRATVIGETTGGGAHPGGTVRLTDHFSAFIPTGRAINPITKTNWEGTGVTPHVPVSQEIALDTAYKLALEEQLKTETDENQKRALQRLIDKTAQKLAEADKTVAAGK